MRESSVILDVAGDGVTDDDFFSDPNMLAVCTATDPALSAGQSNILSDLLSNSKSILEPTPELDLVLRNCN